MQAYRDQYATLFGSDASVTLLAISTDGPRRLAEWARDLGAPFRFGADTTDAVGKLYGAKYPILPIHRRHVVVVGPDGRVAYEARPFRELSQPAYDSLGAAVSRLRAALPRPSEGSGPGADSVGSPMSLTPIRRISPCDVALLPSP